MQTVLITGGAGFMGHNLVPYSLETETDQTINWYFDREDWRREVTSGAYKPWIDKNYGLRIVV